jgi:hypothetical protein
MHDTAADKFLLSIVIPVFNEEDQFLPTQSIGVAGLFYRGLYIAITTGPVYRCQPKDPFSHD